MSDFEDRLLGALKEEIATRKAEDTMTTVTPARRRRSAGLAAAVAGVAAAATAVVVATGVLGGPAYAVTKGADGGVGVLIHAFTDPEGLEAELAGAGVPAVVDYLPQGQTCRAPRGAHGDGAGQFAGSIGREGDGIAFRIEKGQVPAGSTLVLTVSKSADGDDQPPFATSLEIVQGAVAPCEPTSMPLPGQGDTSQQEGEGFDTGTEQGPSLDSKTG
ncbi:hypothetical protein FXF51_25100 [Nonomuraea sp. PA05]|uniref:hypothetical protein n=1 Tax=Nonomuraea sp. PA05 TaxID=2604466 RepID=UPI0011DB91BD|nr:hypothetical protein [Nonomuraea sp. PA05]TYB62713.1 hypothetical protein FXF51_25100 [Nonomuraea sp. PA05]